MGAEGSRRRALVVVGAAGGVVAMVVASLLLLPRAAIAEGEPADNTILLAEDIIAVSVVDKDGKRRLELAMPAREALPILTAAFESSPDSNFKYRILSKGLLKYRRSVLADEAIRFLAGQYPKHAPYDKVNILMGMFMMSPRSKATKDTLAMARREKGDTAEAKLLRQMGQDFQEYLNSGSAAALAKYHMRPEELEPEAATGARVDQANITRVKVTWLFNTEERALARSAAITDRKEINDLLAFFPETFSGKTSDIAGGWEAEAVIELELGGGVQRRITTNYAVYSLGKGDFDVKGASNLRAFMAELERRHLKHEKAPSENRE